jgi:hypothetical protein
MKKKEIVDIIGASARSNPEIRVRKIFYTMLRKINEFL